VHLTLSFVVFSWPTHRRRDPDKPKRPYSAYNIFAKETYAEIAATNGGKGKATEIMTQVAVKWKATNAAARKPFQDRADKIKAQHVIALAEYNLKKKNGETEKKPRGGRDRTKPKRAMSAYLYFNKEHRELVKAEIQKGLAKDQRPAVTDVMIGLSQRWKQCNEADREPYKAQALEAKVKYDAAMVKWKAKKLLKPKKQYVPQVQIVKKAKGKSSNYAPLPKASKSSDSRLEVDFNNNKVGLRV
tara:strand:+ start:97 stop:828 length:732 start_codon:yes stop_codon:yes gene_type:complete